MDAENIYLEKEIQTLSTPRIYVMLMNKLLQLVAEMEKATKDKNFEFRSNIDKNYIQILQYLLIETSNHPEDTLAQVMDGLYRKLLNTMLAFNKTNDFEYSRQMISMITPIRDAWQTFARQLSPGTTGNLNGTLEGKGEPSAHHSLAEDPQKTSIPSKPLSLKLKV